MRRFIRDLFLTTLAIALLKLGAFLGKTILTFEIESFWSKSVGPAIKAMIPTALAPMVDALSGFWGGVVVTLVTLLIVRALTTLWDKSHEKTSDSTTLDESAKRTVLRLRFSGKLEPPASQFEENVASWFAYWSPGGRAVDQNGKMLFEVPSSWALFVTFEKPVIYRQARVSFSGASVEHWEIRQSLSSSLVITFAGPIPLCDVEVSAGL